MTMAKADIVPNHGRGRPKGALNHATRELKEFWHEFFVSEAYRVRAQQRMLAGDAPHLESYLMQLIYGKPRESVDVNVTHQVAEDFSALSTEQLAERVKRMSEQLTEMAALEAAIPAEFKVEGAA